MEPDVEQRPGSCGPELISLLLNSQDYCTGAAEPHRPWVVWGPEVMNLHVPAGFSAASELAWDP